MKGKLTDLGLLYLRIALSLGLMWHGYGKLMRGVDVFAVGVGEMGFPVPLLFAWMAVLSELIGGLFILLGLWTRWVAIFPAITVGTAFFVRHQLDEFGVKEKALAYLVVIGFFMLVGPGKYAVHPSGAGGRKSSPKKVDK
jgi:putative oxidoreductase